MRKTWIFLIVLALLAFSVPVFADGPAAPAGPTVKFAMTGFWWANYDPSVTAGNNAWVASGMQRVWPTADIAFDPNNTLEIALRLPGITGLSTETNFGIASVNHPATGVPTIDSTSLWGDSPLVGNQWALSNSLWHFMWTSDLTAAAGMKDSPVDVKFSVGIMDSVLTNWWYDNNGWEWEYGAASKTPGTNWDAQLVTINADSNFIGYNFAIGVGPVIFHWVNDYSFQNTLVGAEASVMGLGVFVAYGVYNGASAGDGTLAIEAKYDVPQISDITLKPSLFFRDDVSGVNWVFGGDLTVGYQMFKLIVGATTTNLNALEHYSATFHVLPTSPADIWIGAYLDGATPDNAPLQAVDIGASYTFGAFKFIVGWVVGGADQVKAYYTGLTRPNTNTGTQFAQANNPNGGITGNNVTLGNDNVGAVRNGFYFGSAISF